MSDGNKRKKTPVKAVIDPNVLVSGALSERGSPWGIIRRWHEGSFELIVSQTLLYELQVVLMRRKFRRYLTAEEALEYVLWFREGATLAEESEVRTVSRDPDDDYLFALAENSGADYLVSGDGDLLELRDMRAAIISPRDFHAKLRDRREET